MNRRGFIGTLTALAGVVLAKIKAPSAPLRPDFATLAPEHPTFWVRKTPQGLVAFTKNKLWECGTDYRWREWKHPISSDYGKLLTLNDYHILVDTCKHCGAQAHPGYELICTCKPS